VVRKTIVCGCHDGLHSLPRWLKLATMAVTSHGWPMLATAGHG
jgi:hypothetical protein